MWAGRSTSCTRWPSRRRLVADPILTSPAHPLQTRKNPNCLLSDARLYPAVLLTNHLHLGATTIAAIYRDRWQVELFFKALKQT
jgi:IS4 transposase